MKFRAFVSRVQELNNYLDKFPEEVEGVSPTLLELDEIKDILHHALPQTWQDAMTMQGFNYPSKTIDEMVEFCERYENLEEMVIPKKKKTSKKESSSNTKKSKKRKASSDLSSEDSFESSNYKYCRYHGKCKHTKE